MKELFDLIQARRREPSVPHAVATVLRVEGSSYRRPGARMLVNVHGRVAGSVSGGCLEKAVISKARQALLDGESRLMTFDTTDQDDLAFGSSLGCNGKIWIGVEALAPGQPLPLEVFVERVRRHRTPAALITSIFAEGPGIRFQTHAAFADTPESATGLVIPQNELRHVFEHRRSRFVDRGPSGSALVEWLGPPLALFLFGAGPDVLPLLRIAHELGHEVTVVDRRAEYARADHFPGATRVVLAKPPEVATYLEADDRTAAILMNHHYDTDRDVLASLLPLDLPYIAMLGPKKRTSRILDELRSEGHDVDTAAETLHGPAGLDIGAETPEQIALAILAEIQATLAGRKGGKLRQRQEPIHTPLPFQPVECAIPV
jgi:xanthine dehydrogenase accessory factor